MQNGLLNAMLDHGTRRYVKATAIQHVTVPIVQCMFDNFVKLMNHIGPESRESAILIEYLPYAKYCSVSNDAMAYNNRGAWLNCTITPNWANNLAFDAYAKEWVYDLIAQLEEVEKKDETVSKEDEVVGKRGYFNGSMGDEKSQLVFKLNYPRLQQLKKKYDPDMVFRKWYPITPALEN